MKKNYFATRRVFLLLIFLLAGAMLLSLMRGQVPVPAGAVLSILFGHPAGAATPEQTAVILHVRLPRTLVALLVGAALAVSGAVMQGVLGNPLADPGIIGVASGAALGAVIAIALGFSGSHILYMPLMALLGALLAVGITVFLSLRDGRVPTMVLLLSGITVSMLLVAITHGILTFMNEYRLREFLFWMVGGLDYRRWEHVYLAAGPVLAGIAALCLLARHLNVLALGEREARAVGLPVAFFRLLLLFLAALTTATAVCVSGTIGFVGLMVPHILRIILGPEHRVLLPACALAGGLFLVGCDTLGRTLFPVSELRVGVVTALLGAPYFLYLLRRAGREGGMI